MAEGTIYRPPLRYDSGKQRNKRKMAKGEFRFKQFLVRHDRCAMKVGTDGVLLGAWARGGRRILDIGTGSGLVALMMAQRFPEASVVGVEIDKEACAQAGENMAESPFADRMTVVCGKIQELSFPYLFDAIVCNPPFFPDESLHSPDKRRAIARHNDQLPFAELFATAARMLTDNGSFSVVLPSEVLAGVLDVASRSGLRLSRKLSLRSRQGKEVSRLLLEFSKQRDVSSTEEEQVIYAMDNSRSAWYQELTQAFYLSEEELAVLKAEVKDRG